jgi:chemotaxis protein methyltransferase CheR
MLTLTDQDIDSITNIIFKSTQMDFRQYAKSSLNRRLIRLAEMHQLNSVDELKDYTASIPDTNKLIEEITVNTTEMFRDPSFWQALRTQILPQLNSHDNVRIWHAGCSTGEEVISMQILLEELGMRHKVQAFASDINMVVMAVAQKSSYSLKNYALSNKNYEASGGDGNLDRYVDIRTDHQVTFRPDLLSNVTFKRFDLVQDQSTKKFDLILCRNVLIYFDFALQEMVIGKFIKSLFSGGFIVIGQKESIISPDLLNKIKLDNEAEKVFKLLQ